MTNKEEMRMPQKTTPEREAMFRDVSKETKDIDKEEYIVLVRTEPVGSGNKSYYNYDSYNFTGLANAYNYIIKNCTNGFGDAIIVKIVKFNLPTEL